MNENQQRGRRPRSDRALNRTKLVEAARKLWTRDADADMAEVAAAAGVARSTAYRHFPSREALVTAVRTQVRDDAESNDVEHLRPAGELAHVAPSPLSITEVLNKVPPHQVGDQVVAEAQRLDRVTSAAVYLVDLEGTTMQRLAGPPTFPSQIMVPLAVGPEIPREGVAALRAVIDELLPGIVVAPLYLRGRATGVLLAVGATDDALRDLAAEAAAAIALADVYTDHIDAVRRLKPTSPAAEIQQQLLPPRILRLAGALVAGNVLPGYDIGGDWFDYAENPDCAWVGISDTEGRGTTAAGLGTVTLGAFRAARQRTTDPWAVIAAVHRVLSEVARDPVTATATIATWNAPSSTVTWLTCGEHAPILVSGKTSWSCWTARSCRGWDIVQCPTTLAPSTAGSRPGSGFCCCPTASSAARPATAGRSASTASAPPLRRRRRIPPPAHCARSRTPSAKRSRTRSLTTPPSSFSHLAALPPKSAATRHEHRVPRWAHRDGVAMHPPVLVSGRGFSCAPLRRAPARSS